MVHIVLLVTVLVNSISLSETYSTRNLDMLVKDPRLLFAVLSRLNFSLKGAAALVMFN